MALNYSVALRPNPFEERRAGESVRHGTGQWRAVAQATESPDIQANHRQPCGRGGGIDLHRREPARCPPRGKAGGISASWANSVYRSSTRGRRVLSKFTSTNITGVNIQYIPGEDLKNIFAGLEFQPVASRKAQQAVLRAEKAGETSVDISKKPASGGDDSESPDEI